MANTNSKNKPVPVYLSTGIKALNEILEKLNGRPRLQVPLNSANAPATT